MNSQNFFRIIQSDQEPQICTEFFSKAKGHGLLLICSVFSKGGNLFPSLYICLVLIHLSVRQVFLLTLF